MSDPFDLSDIETAPAPAGEESPAYLDSLNDEQRAAVEATEGPVLVLAGAGTGKTRVLATRLAHILVTARAHPSETLAVTFTNKAAREMKERVERLLGRSVEGWYLGTFHAIAARLLRRHAELVGLKSSFTIIDTDDQVRLVKQVMAANDIDDGKWPARTLATIISRWKDRGLDPDKVTGERSAEFANGRAVELYRQYQERLITLNAADFGDLLLHNLTLFMADAEVLADYHRRFRYILVDEYQDTNVAQYLWLRLLAQKHRNICCVGDDDQSIYAWRGAEVGNILRFERDFPGARVIRLERNYRSTTHILGAASGLIAHNEGRLGKILWTDGEGETNERVRVLGVWDGEEEARTVSDEIESLHAKRHALNEIAILVRASFQTRAFEERFIQIGLPYRVIGGLRFYERLEIRDAVAYLRVIAQPADDLALERIINRPKRGIGDATVQTLNLHARARDLPLLEAARELVESDELRGRARSAIRDLIDSIDRWRTLARDTALPALAGMVLDESGYTGMWQNDRSADAPGRLENLKELVVALEEFDTLEGFLEHVSLVMENAEGGDADMVNLMTLHGAKGLEFDTVFLPGWEEELFPNRRSLDAGGLAALEEERRLAYVGLTRARRRAMVLHATRRQAYGQWLSTAPSRFVAELPDEHVERGRVTTAFYAGFGDAKPVDPADFERPTIGRRSSNWARYAGRRAEPAAIETRSHAPGTLAVGTRVFHRKFGYGLIRAIDGNKLEIAFDKAGTKKVMDSFVTPA
jgi:DNA helicase-2/ATP-dependent DNA helicase PcrA